ncbi:MAG: sulfur oxidation c-type cytochrome SoxX [Pseudomonadota bacterium]|nr:sulfur oxidation c-type cytochrome SoxX [Pseudomonadota bacterium]
MSGFRLSTTPALAALALGAVQAAEKEYCDWEVDNFAVQQPLCGLQGDAKRGRTVALNRSKGNCLACHQMPIPEEDFHGNLAPPLNSVGARYDPGQLRARVVDIKQINPNSLMPSFYKHPDNLNRVSEKFRGKTVLTAQEVEDVVVYLSTLKQE